MCRILSAVVGPAYINLYLEYELSCSNGLRDEHGVLKLMVRHRTGPPILYRLPGNAISATVGLVYINLQPKYELPNSTRFGQFQKFEKFQLGHCLPSPPLRKNFYTGSEFLFIATCASDLIFLAPLTLKI